MRIGIVAGMQAELDAFRPELAGERAPLHGLSVRRLTHAGHPCALACGGIGKVAAATAATLLVADGAEMLLVIGTAARIGLGPGGAFRIVDAVQPDYGARTAERLVRYDPGSIPIGPERPLMPFAASPLAIDLPTARIASGDVFVESATDAAEIGTALSATLIDMETAAVAQVATLLDRPWAAIKAATDAADADSAGSFIEHLSRAARAAAEAAERAIAAL